MKKVKLVVSDFHLGKGLYFKDGTKNILEDFVYDREFSEFLHHYCSGEYKDAEVELILNGDILNLLQMDAYGIHTHLVTERIIVRALKRIIEGHPEFFSALRRFAGIPGHKVSFVIGNHDAGMLFPKAKEEFSRAVGSEVAFHDVAYRFDGIHVEHGQQYERFHRIDMERPFISRGLPEPVLNMPWGSLFVAVLLPRIKQSMPHIDKVRPFSAFLVWAALNRLIWGVQTLVQVARFILHTVLFKTKYQIRRGARSTFALLKEIQIYPSFDKIAFRILDENADVFTVIFGHTHVLRYRQYRGGKQYINEGTWNEVTNLDLGEYGTRTRLSYASVEYQDAGRKPLVRLKEWKGEWRSEVELLA